MSNGARNNLIRVGSTAFFDNIKSKDNDFIELVDSDNDNFIIREYCGVGSNKQDIIQVNINKGKTILFSYDLNRELGLALGKYLIKDFNDYFGITISDLIKLKPLVEVLDNKHLYEKVIYKSYLENNDFYLTEEQREKALEVYLKYR